MVMTKKLGFGALFGLLVVLPSIAGASPALEVTSPFNYSFSTPGVLEESRLMGDSSSPYFWLASGAKLIVEDGVGKTIQGPLVSDNWKNIYAKKNAVDTDLGVYPQNSFRLLTRSEWHDFTEEVSFKINKTNLTDSYNRDAYSGFFLFSKFKNDNNYYYAGVRMDGQAVIKKKVNGVFYTLGSVQVFGETRAYNRDSNPNLLPQDKALRLRLVTKDLSDTSSELLLYVDRGDGIWLPVLDVTDKNALRGITYAGIESDFMDVVLDNYNLSSR